MGVKNERYLMSGQSSNDIIPSSRDSANYRRGYERGIAGGKEFPNEGQVEKMGRWEGQNVGKKKKMSKGGSVGKPKMKMGGSCGTPKTLKKKK